jgi:hypothetical protein
MLRASQKSELGLHQWRPVLRRSEAEAYRRDLPEPKVHALDAEHLALNTAADEIEALVPTLRNIEEMALPTFESELLDLRKERYV